jgi:phospholipid/cholesterol/gamma-HCH transport system substrate-binding protein
MERNANYALVGIASTILLVGLLVFAVLLAGNKFSRDYDTYDIVFQGPVRGLSQGAEVHFNGIKVGDVSRISLDPHNSQLVIARARVTSDVPIRADSYASLEPQGITGVNYIQITAGTPTKPLLKDTVGEGQVPRMGSVRDALSDLLAGGGFVLQRAVEALDRVNRVFSDDNLHNLSATIENVQEATAELKEHRAIIEDAQKTLQDADESVKQITALAKSSQSVVDDDGRKTIVKLGDAATEIQGAAKDLRVMLRQLQGPTDSFATTGLPQLTSTLESVQRATDHLDRVLREVHSDPGALIGKGPAKQIEVKP